MKSMLIKNIKRVDQFGSQFIPRIHYNHKGHKTLIGGLASIIIYSLSLCYFIYGMVQWGTNQNLPKVTITNYLLNDYVFNVDGLIAQMYIRPQANNSLIDPFAKDNMIFMVFALVSVNGYPNSSLTQFLPPTGTSIYNRPSISFKNQSFAININNQKSLSSMNYLVVLQLCDQATLTHFKVTGYKCANSSHVNAFFGQPLNVLTISTEVQQYDVQAQQMKSILKQNSIALEQNSTQFVSAYLRTGQNQIDTGILFQNINQQVVISDLSTIQQTMSQSYFQKILGDSVYAVFDFELDYIQIQYNIEFQKINDALADIGSIVSLLMMLQIFFYLYSEYQQNQYVQRKVIEIYIPEIKNVCFQKNYLGQITRIHNTSDSTEYDIKQFQEYYRKLRRIVRQKLTVINQIYEICQLQLLINSTKHPNEQINIKSKPNEQIVTQSQPIRLTEDTQNQFIHKKTISPMQEQNIDQSKSPMQEVKLDQSQEILSIPQAMTLDQIFQYDDFIYLMQRKDLMEKPKEISQRIHPAN